jgi:hypothetical protein
MTSTGFVVNEADTCVYYHFGGGEGVVLCLYVDDILIFGTNISVINDVKSFLSQHFDMKDLKEADVILNVKLIKDESRITLKQSHYVENILSRFGYSDCKPSPIPYDPSVKLHKNRGNGIDQLWYSQIIGSLMYLAGATRPDISFATSKLRRFTSNPGNAHWCALERVIRYLRGTTTYGLHYTRYSDVLEGYTDANWISDADDIKSTRGYIFTIGGAAISWRSRKQTILTNSTMEAGPVALEMTTSEAEWLRELLIDLPVVSKPVSAILLRYDNESVITIVGNAKENLMCMRHAKRWIKTMRHLRHAGAITVEYINTSRNLAGPFTKGLACSMIDEASKQMGLQPTWFVL